MSIEDIESVQLPNHSNQNIFTSFLNLLNSYQNQNTSSEIDAEHNDEHNNEHNDDVENEVDDVENEVDDVENEVDVVENEVDVGDGDNLLTSTSNNNSTSLNNEDLNINFSLNLENNINNLSLIENNENLNYNLLGTIPNFLISNNLNTENNTQITFEYNTLLNNTNIINQILGQMATTHNQNNQEDINITMDKNDIDNLKILKYSQEFTTNCSICLMDVEKDNEYYQIKCNHIFHKKCLEKWLEEYNYVCPICRTELGNSKAHLENEEDLLSSESPFINDEEVD